MKSSFNGNQHVTKLTAGQKFFRNTRRLLTVIIIGGALYGGYQYGNLTVKTEVVYAEDTSHQMFQEKIESLKQGVVDQLMACESAGYKEEDGLIVFDSNAKASIGNAQWQVASVIHYVKLLRSKDITKKEAVLLALDRKEAGELAKQVMFETKNMAGRDWVNCDRKLGLDNQIKLIKQLEK